MFEVSFPELVILAVVALLVLGPERLPRAARFVGLWVRKARAQWYAVKGEFEREMAAEDLKRSLAEARQAMDEARGSMQQVDAELRDASDDIEAAANDVLAPVHGRAAEAAKEIEASEAGETIETGDRTRPPITSTTMPEDAVASAEPSTPPAVPTDTDDGRPER